MGFSPEAISGSFNSETHRSSICILIPINDKKPSPPAFSSKKAKRLTVFRLFTAQRRRKIRGDNLPCQMLLKVFLKIKTRTFYDELSPIIRLPVLTLRRSLLQTNM